MYLCFDEAIKIGIQAYRDLDYSESCISAFKLAVKELKKYMENISFPYSLELSQKWINKNKKHWKLHKLKSSRKAINVLSDIMKNGYITTSLQSKITRTPPYQKLPNWSKTLLDQYLKTLTYSDIKYLIQIRNNCSRFFLFLKLDKINNVSDITHQVVKSFFNSDFHISSKAKGRCNNHIRHCLMYLANLGLIQKSIALTLNQFVIADLIIVKELPEVDRNNFSSFLNVSKDYILSTKKKYDIAAKKLIRLHKNKKYSSTIQKVDFQVIRNFRIFMDANSFAYSYELVQKWLKYQKVKWSGTKYLAFRKPLLSINEIVDSETLRISCFSTHKTKFILSEWGNNLLSQYLKEREQEGCTNSTLETIRCSCSRFITFLDNQNIMNPNEISPNIIKKFQTYDNHKTVEAKNAYAIKIRGFLRFLARNKLVSDTLELAISTEIAPNTSIVNTLSDSQIGAIHDFRKNAKYPKELRDIAIVMLGLKMGLRASDIANLKLTDISWKDGSISFTQQKTGVHLKLPLPVDVGNSLYYYIRHGRPQTESQHIFVHHRAPYCGFKNSNFGRILNAIVLSQCGDKDTINGFHITRKTFASELLKTETPITTIAALLGHAGVNSVDEYLATNEDKMHLCAIGLAGIEYSGGANL